MSGFSVADLIKPTLESLNSSEEKLFIKETMKRNIDEKNSFQLINNNIINNDNNDWSVMIVPLNSSEEHKNIIHRITSTRNDIVKKSRIENNNISKSSNQSSENLVSDSEITLNSLQSTSQIKFDVNNASNILSSNNNNTDIVSESSPAIFAQSFNSINNLSKEEITIQSINKINPDASIFSGSTQRTISNDLTLFPTVISSSSPLSSLTNSSSFGSNTEEQLQILLKLHNLFGITSPNKSISNNINLTNLNSADNNFNDQLFLNNILPNPNQNSLGQSNPNISLNSYPETIVPFNSSYIMSVMMNTILNKEQLEELTSSASSSSLYQPYLNYLHHQNYLEQQQPQQKHQQQLRHQQSTELNSQLTAVNRNRLIANFLKSRFMLDNNCGQNVFQDLNEIAKLDHSNISLNNYDNFIKNSMGRNVLITSDSRKPKRIRTAFSPAQLFQLESAFEKNHYVVGQERKDLATDLNLTETQVKVWFQNRRTKYKRLHTDGKEILSDSNSKGQKSLSDIDEDSDDDGDDDDDDDDEEEEDVNDKLVKKDEGKDNVMIESIHQNQNNLEFEDETHSKFSNSESSKRISINTFPIQNSYSITDNKQFSPSKECQQYLDNSRSNNPLGNQRINDLSEKSKINDYTKYTWNSFKQIHENLNTNTGIERKQSSILHSSQHLLNSVNQNLNYLQHSCR
ncbi:unnamed protein product [Schistosoma spindalis]|nr:unnamed protein product [Schistosoma spindale]